MVIFKKVDDLQAFLAAAREQSRTIGFVPTMGALHEGHRSLIDASVQNGGVTVCSIFVNPTQFNDPVDFEKYPVTIEADILLLTEAGCDVLFLPDVAGIYPEGAENARSYSFGYLETVLEGAQRPGHFKGVGQVMNRLLEIIQPDDLYMGQKDYQQCMVVTSLLEQMGKKDAIRMHICATRREADGLAMSSRNRRLTEPQRAISAVIYQCLVSIQSKQASDTFAIVQKECLELLKDKGFEPEYVALATADGLRLLDNYESGIRMVALIAAKLGGVRLIDNMVINP
ncbi:pantoate--beta-alanine ligase [Chitinophagaceae bacterium MMS25-I14]